MTAWQFLGCLIAADFITGAFHFIEQTYGLPTWPLLGQSVIVPNIDHHKHPARICEGNLWTRNWQMWALALGACSLARVTGCLSWTFCMTALLASCGNETHSWAHGNAPRLGRLLQEAGILLTPANHRKHHKPPYDRNFCTITNLTNAVLDSVQFWRGMEACISVLGVPPKRLSKERDFV